MTDSVWDFGYLPQKSEVDHVYYIRNDGSEPLVVEKIKSGCACTSVSEIDDSIMPGDSVPIRVTFKSGRYHRRVIKLTEIHTNDPETPVRKLKIAADVVKRGEPTGTVSIRPWKLEWILRDDSIVPAVDTLSFTNVSEDTLRTIVLRIPENVMETIESPGNVAPGDTASIILYPVENGSLRASRGHSVTLAFVGGDTTIVTIPLEIGD